MQPHTPPTRQPRLLDVRAIPCSTKHGLVVRTWRDLPLGDTMVLVNDHDPVPLRRQFDAECPGTFTWEYLERGPDQFRIKITKLKPLPPVGESGKAYGCSGH